jgi:hypothetical protein
MYLLGLLLLLVVFASLLEPCQGSLESRQDVNVQTSFWFYPRSCSDAKQEVIKQAQLDALTLANAALDVDTELLSHAGTEHKYIDCETQAAIEYFGPLQANLGHRQCIFDTFFRATQAYRGWGWSDWWNRRYIEIHCDDIKGDCDGKVVAYYHNKTKSKADENLQYNVIVYCDVFFKKLRSHAEAIQEIEADTTFQKVRNVRNLRSRGKSVPQTHMSRTKSSM